MKGKKPLLNYVAPLQLKIRKKEEEEEEEAKAAPAPEYHFPHPDQGTLTNLWNQRCLAPKFENNLISYNFSQNDFLPSRAKTKWPGKI